MKTLYLLRHAKSSWAEPHLHDRDRPLNRRGQRDAPRMGAALSLHMAPPDVHVSAARRARLTLEGLCAGWPGLEATAHVTDESLYTFSSADLRRWIASRDDTAEALFIIGHNPALTDLVNELADGYALDNLPTAGFAELALHIDHWHLLMHGCGELRSLLLPRML